MANTLIVLKIMWGRDVDEFIFEPWFSRILMPWKVRLPYAQIFVSYCNLTQGRSLGSLRWSQISCRILSRKYRNLTIIQHNLHLFLTARIFSFLSRQCRRASYKM